MDRSKVTTLLLSILTIIAVGAVLKAAQSVIIPLVLAWLLSQLLSPMVLFLIRHRIPAILAISIVLILFLVLVYWVGFFVSANATSFLEQLPIYKTKLISMITNIVSGLSDKVSEVSNMDFSAELSKQIVNFSGTAMGFLGNMVGKLTTIVAKLIIIFVFLAFMLMGKPYIGLKISKAFPPSIAYRVTTITGAISARLSHYLIVQFLISLVTGTLVWLTCSLIGIGSAATWGAMAFFLNFVPTIGSIIASIPPVLLALVQFYPKIWPAVIAAISILAIQQFMGNFLTPKALGDTLNLSPVVILISLLFWGWLWGPVGALLSVLIASSIKIVCEQIEVLHPISILMGSGKEYQKKAD